VAMLTRGDDGELEQRRWHAVLDRGGDTAVRRVMASGATEPGIRTDAVIFGQWRLRPVGALWCGRARGRVSSALRVAR
jgi:hypothetical protein